MIYLYPANKMENLLALFNQIQQVSPLSLFQQEVVIVQNQGMQHWLNLSLAQQRNIAMNYSYALPSQYLWKLLRSLVSEHEMPEQSPYSREVLVWRIDDLLQSETVRTNSQFTAVTQYWLDENEQKSALNRYQLAQQLADLFEQYLVFRPDWLNAWQQGEVLTSHFQIEQAQSLQQWQALLWQLLTEQIPYDPVQLIKIASENLAKSSQHLPSRISFFGINSLPPP